MNNKLIVKMDETSNGKPQRLPDAKQLQDLGFNLLSKLADAERRLAIAREHYRRLSDRVDICAWCHHTHTKIAKWDYDIPPDDVLDALKQAKERKCFERFVIYSIGADPILMGVVSDLYNDEFKTTFVIAHWGNDIDPIWLEKNTE